MTATIKDIAKKTGLGLATISKYLNGGNVLSENREAIEAAIIELNFRPNSFARSLKTKRSKAIGVVLPEINNAFFTEILTETEYVLKREGYAIFITDCHNEKEKEIQAMDFLLSKGVDGIISIPLSRSGRHLRPAVEQNVPVLLVDRAIPELAGEVDTITIDNELITHEAVQKQIIEKGHRRIGIVTGTSGIYTADARLRGYRKALKDSGIEYDPALVCRGALTVEGGKEGYRKLMGGNADMTAVLATNHYLTMGVLIAIHAEKRRIPDGISMVGFDAMDWLQLVNPPITTVDQPLREMGRLAGEILLARLTGMEKKPKQSIVLKAGINIGQSVKTIKI